MLEKRTHVSFSKTSKLHESEGLYLYMHDKITASWLVERSAINSLIALWPVQLMKKEKSVETRFTKFKMAVYSAMESFRFSNNLWRAINLKFHVNILKYNYREHLEWKCLLTSNETRRF